MTEQPGAALFDLEKPIADIKGDEIDAELAEIDENLMRAELSPAQEAAHLARREELWKMRRAESGTNCPTLTGRGNKAFAAETAERTGRTKQSINKATPCGAITTAETYPRYLPFLPGHSCPRPGELCELCEFCEGASGRRSVGPRHCLTADAVSPNPSMPV